MSAQDSGTDTSRELELPKEVVKLQRARHLGIKYFCASFLHSLLISLSLSFFFFIFFFLCIIIIIFEFLKCHLNVFELTAALGAELEADSSRWGFFIGF